MAAPKPNMELLAMSIACLSLRALMIEAALAKSLKPAALEGLKLDAANFNSDIHADRDYRANLVRVMAGRAVAKLSGKK